MGSIALPASGTVYLDANAIIYSVEKNPTYWPLLMPVWAAARAGTIQMMTSELSVMETFVGPLKAGNQAVLNLYDTVLHSPSFSLAAIDEAILRKAAELRAGLENCGRPTPFTPRRLSYIRSIF